LTEFGLGHVILAIISISSTVAGIASSFIISEWNRLKSSMSKLESYNPLEVEVARREMHVIRFIILSHVIAVFMFSINSVVGLILLTSQYLSLQLTLFISLILFSTGLYSFLIPFIVTLKDDFYLIKLHERMITKKR
jgi:hypothetical protein